MALDRLATPEEIIAAELPPEPAARATPRWRDALALMLLVFGGWLFWVGWCAGVALLWGSTNWGRRDKWIGTLVLPGGLLPGTIVLVQLLIQPRGSDDGPNSWLVTFLVVAPFAAALHLARARREPGAL